LEGAKILQKLGDLQTELNGYQDWYSWGNNW
jgi:hypothetical protein